MSNFRQKKIPWGQGLVTRSLIAVVTVVILLSVASSLIVSQTVREQEQQQTLQSLNELVDAVENTASVASFTNDEQLATEVVQGLMRNSDVSRVSIRFGDQMLAQAERQNATNLSINDLTRKSLQQDVEHVVHQLDSPFQKGEIIGEIILTPDWRKIDARIKTKTLSTMFLQAGQMALVVAITAAIMFLLVVRPIKRLSDSLNKLDGSSGKKLDVPKQHTNTEIGRLVGDINDLTGRLAATLDKERSLQQQQIVERRKYQDLFDNASSGIFVADRRGLIIAPLLILYGCLNKNKQCLCC